VSRKTPGTPRRWRHGSPAEGWPLRARRPDYWVVNLIDGVLEVYRQPVRALARRYGWKYGSVRLLKRNAVVSPLARPRGRVRVADVLP